MLASLAPLSTTKSRVIALFIRTGTTYVPPSLFIGIAIEKFADGDREDGGGSGAIVAGEGRFGTDGATRFSVEGIPADLPIGSD